MQQLTVLQKTVLASGIAFAVVLFSLISWAYRISNQILGPYERIIREIDLILSGGSRKLLHVRRRDDVFAELVERINALIIEKYERRPEYTEKVFPN